MKFLRECFPCCTTGRPPAYSATPSLQRSEENVPLAPHPYTPVVTMPRRRMRHKRWSNGSTWRPTLEAIYEEDNGERDKRSTSGSDVVQKNKAARTPRRNQLRYQAGHSR